MYIDVKAKYSLRILRTFYLGEIMWSWALITVVYMYVYLTIWNVYKRPLGPFRYIMHRMKFAGTSKHTFREHDISSDSIIIVEYVNACSHPT